MQSRKKIIMSVICVMLALPTIAVGQASSVNTFSPYTLYGIGELSSQGTADIRSMGGVGVAYRNSTLNPYLMSVNPLNPASYSAVRPRSFIFNFEVEGGGHFLKDKHTKSSHNSFNVKNVSVLLPLTSKLGFGVSISPYSSVGYKLEQVITDPEVVGSIGRVTKRYEGSGDVSQLKVGVGMELFRNFSLGVEGIYYFGYIDRTQDIEFDPITSGGGFANTHASMNEDVSKILLSAGFQYNIIAKNRRLLTVGGTYRMGGKMNDDVTKYIPSGDPYGDTVYFSRRVSKLYMADVLAIGAFFQTNKIGVGVDYSFANWGYQNKQLNTSEVRYRNTNAVNIGVQYTPNRFDVRKFMNRVTYRFGMKYEQDYLQFGNKKMVNKAVTLGVGVPIKAQRLSNINVGLEYGQRGTTQSGLVKINYFKVSIGFSLFGEDYWFMKRKID